MYFRSKSTGHVSTDRMMRCNSWIICVIYQFTSQSIIANFLFEEIVGSQKRILVESQNSLWFHHAFMAKEDKQPFNVMQSK